MVKDNLDGNLLHIMTVCGIVLGVILLLQVNSTNGSGGQTIYLALKMLTWESCDFNIYLLPWLYFSYLSFLKVGSNPRMWLYYCDKSLPWLNKLPYLNIFATHFSNRQGSDVCVR